ncbi:hypothetical protein VTK73DRAFT_357 [Phialemonium thermophilum]|uniref:Uncharacterized protein n=1 Tax=Phialemonium thermophilum TaxID=223376 RepID=A0ABR3VVI8_9PEZI
MHPKVYFAVEWEVYWGFVPAGEQDPLLAFAALLPPARSSGVLADPSGREACAIYQSVEEVLRQDPDVAEHPIWYEGKRWPGNVDPRRRWTLATNLRLHTTRLPGDGRSLHWCLLQIASPRLAVDQPNSYRAVDRAVRLLKTNFRLYLDHSTSLRVHIGHWGRDLPLSVTATKELGTLLLLAESRLDDLYRATLRYAVPEIPAGSYRLAKQHRSLRECSLLALQSHRDMRRWDRRLHDYDSWDNSQGNLLDLCLGLTCPLPGIAVDYNFAGLCATAWDRTSDEATTTLEFRGMEATFSPHTVVHWVKVCVRLVGWAIESGILAFRQVLGRLFEEPESYSVLQLLADIGCSADTVAHFKRKFRADMGCCARVLSPLGYIVPAQCWHPEHNEYAA